VTSPAPPPRLETARLLLGEWRETDFAPHAGHWALRGYGKWAVERRDSGEWIGRVGLWNPPDWPGVEVGWTLVRAAWGQGYATEAATAAIGWAWANLGCERLVSLIEPGNAASFRVAERLGMQPLPEELTGTDLVVYVLERPPR